MGETTHISWANASWSPWTGCTKISPACDGCYAAHLMDTRMGRVEWGEPGAGEGTRALMSDAYWRKPLAWNREAARTGARPWVFPSLCDPFDTAVEPAWRWRFVLLMEATPNIVWLLLTKRIGNVLKMTDPARGERPLPRNAAVLSTVVTQGEVDRDLPKLAEVKRRLKPLFIGVSVEPMIEEIDLTPFLGDLDWVICGGETDQGSHKARPSNPQWFRDLRDQCAAAGVPFHFKQWGEWVSVSEVEGFVGNPIHEFSDGRCVRRVGKRTAGRLLDGREHNGRPTLLEPETNG